ncbi:unnamed protein product [Parascedosporium putredinis]|uniref:Uncharacterized protein n=1 Tax=Parascedosporium putredinis TaxID=1442378 RepID=A0A9P1HBT1_9PEZI|nr:unnamed protein product [Parascedosporium putredinis]CAI8005188.1 unnamed protein product [Parascedosporium putredinis]
MAPVAYWARDVIFLPRYTHATALTEEELVVEKKLRRKLDLMIMPLMIWTYLMNYIDRNNYAAARLQGLEEDLKLTDTQCQL